MLLKKSNFTLPKPKHGAHIGILGGSFDPPHLGHQLLALSALATEELDQVWVMPCAAHVFDKNLRDFRNRYKMCKLAFRHIKNTKVINIESFLESPSYTVKTLESINSKRPDLKLSLIMGSDLIEHFDSWEGAGKIREMAALLIFDRKTLLPEAQSTLVREAVKLGDFKNLDLEVQKYITKHKLYRD